VPAIKEQLVNLSEYEGGKNENRISAVDSQKIYTYLHNSCSDGFVENLRNQELESAILAMPVMPHVFAGGNLPLRIYDFLR
jgi:hypothetical protein